MKKSLTFIVCLSLILVLSLSLVSAGWFSDFFGRITGKVVDEAFCNDSDGGLNYFVHGILTGVNTEGYIMDLSEFCSDDTILHEYYCKEPIPDGNYYEQQNYYYEDYACPNGCEDGVCISTLECIDSDGGDDIYTKGYRINDNSNYADYGIISWDYCIYNPEIYDLERIISDRDKEVSLCEGENCYIIEYHCKTSLSDAHKGYACPNGCENGACVEEEIICSDGTVAEQCSTIKPKYCDSSGNLIDDCTECGCNVGYGCQDDGSCVGTETCINGVCSSHIPPEDYSTINGCEPFLGEKDNPLKILFVKLGNAPYFNELRDDMINNQMKTIPPFKKNFDKMSFYSIEIDFSEDFNCEGSGGSLSGSGFFCDNEKIYQEINQQCTIDDTRGIVTIVIGESEFGGTGGDIIYLGATAERELQIQLGISRNVVVHEVGHNFGLADLYYGTFYFDGSPSQFWPTDFSRAFLNVDGPGCSKWCESYKPLFEYTQSISSQCIQFNDRESCVSFGRDSEKFCTYTGDHPDCCVWSEESFEYFETNCVPAFGSEDIGIDCYVGSGCYYGAVYGNYAWRPVLNQRDSIMFSLTAENFSTIEENILNKIFDCCLSPLSSQDVCKDFRIEFVELLQNYNWKKRIGSCGYKSTQENSQNMEELEEVEVIPEEKIFYKCNGCELEDKCYLMGYRMSGEYCSDEMEFVSQLEESSSCDNNFECKSNLCIDGECISGGLFRKILNWFRKLFGFGEDKS